MSTALLCVGCQRGNPLDEKVSAGPGASFEQWRARHTDDLTAEERQDLDDAIQELKYKLMASGVSGSDEIQAAVSDQTNGKTVREVIELGLRSKIERCEQREADLDAFIAQNSELQTRPGDTDSAEYLDRQRQQQASRRDSVEREITAACDRLKALGLTPPPRKHPAPTQSQSAGTHAPAQNAGGAPESMPELIHP